MQVWGQDVCDAVISDMSVMDVGLGKLEMRSKMEVTAAEVLGKSGDDEDETDDDEGWSIEVIGLGQDEGRDSH